MAHACPNRSYSRLTEDDTGLRRREGSDARGKASKNDTESECACVEQEQENEEVPNRGTVVVRETS